MRNGWSLKAVTKCLAIGLLVFGLTVGLAPVVGAVPINAVDGLWQNALPLGSATIDNSATTRTARWGTPADTFQSGYNWTSASTPFDAPSNGTPFSLGTFNHLNFPITGTSITSIELAFSMTIDALTPLTGTFLFNHNETPNDATPLQNPLNDDIVTISSPFINAQFSFEGNLYNFSVLGFSADGINFVNEFRTQEDKENPAGLYGAITVVPEPATMLLLGSGLIGLAGFARRKFRK